MKKYIIYGTSNVAEKYYNSLTQKYGKDCVECFIDTWLTKKEFCGKRVIKPEELSQLDKDNYLYVLGTYTNKNSMIGELCKYGVRNSNIVVERDYSGDCFEKIIKHVNSILIYPEITEKEKIKNLDIKIRTLVPNLSKTVVYMDVISSLSIENTSFCIKDEVIIDKYDLILVWKKESLNDKKLKNNDRVFCIDNSFFARIETRILLRLNYLLSDDRDKKLRKQVSYNQYKQLCEQYNSKKCYVFGAGPSCKNNLEQIDVRNSVRIVCNGFANNQELMAKIRPNIYAIADEELLTCENVKLVQNIANYIKDNVCVIVTTKEIAENLVARYWELCGKIIVFELDSYTINFPTINNMNVLRKAYNVITALAIPIASAISDDVCISGCDGIDLGKEMKEWEHAENLTAETISTDTEDDYMEYYSQHYAYFEEILQYGEAMGKKYYTYYDSFIPALKKRKIVKNY